MCSRIFAQSSIVKKEIVKFREILTFYNVNFHIKLFSTTQSKDLKVKIQKSRVKSQKSLSSVWKNHYKDGYPEIILGPCVGLFIVALYNYYLRIYKNPVKCSHCGIRFGDANALKSHIIWKKCKVLHSVIDSDED